MLWRSQSPSWVSGMANCQVWQRPAALAPREAILKLEMGHMSRMRIGLVTGVINSTGARFGAAVTDVESPRRGLVIGDCRCGHAHLKPSYLGTCRVSVVV